MTNTKDTTEACREAFSLGRLKAVHFEVYENDGTGTLAPAGYMKRALHAVWHDDQGRRCTQVIGEIFEQAMHPEQGEANARRLAACWNACIGTPTELLEAGHESARQQVEGLSIEQEPKYTTNGRAIVNRASGEEIPADEPVFLFRARDRHAFRVLNYYQGIVRDNTHADAIFTRMAHFLQFVKNHPERMKEPDTTVATDHAGEKGTATIAAQQPETDPAASPAPDIVLRLLQACNGNPYAKIPWPHRVLHDAIREIQGLRKEVALQRQSPAPAQPHKAEVVAVPAEIEAAILSLLFGAIPAHTNHSTVHNTRIKRLAEALRNAKAALPPADTGLLELLKHENPSHPRGIGFNEGVDAAIAYLARQAAKAKGAA